MVIWFVALGVIEFSAYFGVWRQPTCIDVTEAVDEPLAVQIFIHSFCVVFVSM